MKYDIQFKPRAIKDFDRLIQRIQKQILVEIEKMSDGLKGNIKHLANFTPEYRLRVGDYRVLFEIENTAIVIYRIRHRKDVYR